MEKKPDMKSSPLGISLQILHQVSSFHWNTSTEW